MWELEDSVGVMDLLTESSVINFLQESDFVWCILGPCVTVTCSDGVLLRPKDTFFADWVDMERRDGQSV